MADGAESKMEILKELTDEEVEIAARSSYRYLIKSISKDESEKPSLELRTKMALGMVDRHLIQAKGNKQKALSQIKETIQFRKDMNVDGIRLCHYDLDSENKEYAELRALLDKELETPVWQIRGKDKENRTPLNAIVSEKTDGRFHPVEYIRIHMYFVERALACGERLRDSYEDSKFVVYTDCSGFFLACAPPLGVSRGILDLMAKHYPERLKAFYLVDTPLVFRAFWQLIKPFIDPKTKGKMHFITGEEQRRETFSKLIDPEQAMPFSNPDGILTSKFDAKKFTYDTPFDHYYEEKL